MEKLRQVSFDIKYCVSVIFDTRSCYGCFTFIFILSLVVFTNNLIVKLLKSYYLKRVLDAINVINDVVIRTYRYRPMYLNIRNPRRGVKYGTIRV